MSDSKHRSKELGTADPRVSTYDRVSAWLTALILLIGFFAMLLFVFWLGSHVLPNRVRQYEVTFRGEESLEIGDESDVLDEPKQQELADVVEPQIQDVLSKISAVAVEVQKVPLSFAWVGDGDGRKGKPTKRERKPDEPDPTPPWERWEIRFSAMTKQAYAKQLDFFNVELGAIDRKEPTIKYAKNLAGVPKVRVGTRQAEARLYFVHSPGGDLTKFSQALLEEARVETTDRYLAQFYPQETFVRLLEIEKKSLGKRRLSSVMKTIFGIRTTNMGYELFVDRHQFLPGASVKKNET